MTDYAPGQLLVMLFILHMGASRSICPFLSHGSSVILESQKWILYPFQSLPSSLSPCPVSCLFYLDFHESGPAWYILKLLTVLLHEDVLAFLIFLLYQVRTSL
jgi:hypothetical protein